MQISIEECKYFTEHKAVKRAKIPQKIYLPIHQHLGKPCAPILKKDDSVKIGQVIATSDAGVFAPLHSPISGKIVNIDDWVHPTLGRDRAVIIESDGTANEDVFNSRRSDEEINKLTAEEIRKIIFEAGIVGLGGATFPSHIKLNPPQAVNSLIINGAECEPYLTSDARLMAEHSEEILMGIELLARCLNVKDVYIGIEENKPEAIEKFRKKLIFNADSRRLSRRFCRDPDFSSGHADSRGFNLRPSVCDSRKSALNNIKLKILKSEYPQGGEKQLIKNILNREVPSGKVPFSIGVVVHNVGTVFAIFEAVYYNKPLIERVVTVTGSCLENPSNLLVRIGTPIKNIIEECGPFKKEPVKIIMGGPMMGVAQFSLDMPVVKGTSGILLFSKDEVEESQEGPCIRCGECIYNCPVNLMPTLINQASAKDKFILAKELGVLDCIECGLCSWACPAKIELTQRIKYAKLRVPK